jgi:hypothetical protein
LAQELYCLHCDEERWLFREKVSQPGRDKPGNKEEPRSRRWIMTQIKQMMEIVFWIALLTLFVALLPGPGTV